MPRFQTKLDFTLSVDIPRRKGDPFVHFVQHLTKDRKILAAAIRCHDNLKAVIPRNKKAASANALENKSFSRSRLRFFCK